MHFIESDPDRGQTGPFDALVDAVYVLSVQDGAYRRGLLLAHLAPYRFPRVTVYAPPRASHPSAAIWEAHAACARHALAAGFTRVLILEDDCRFSLGPDRLARRWEAALRRLPATWAGLFLGHFPMEAFPVAPGLVRTRSGLTHAYVANRALLEWLAASSPQDPMIPREWFGWSIDSAYALRPDFYALFPMAAFQFPLPPQRRDMGPAPGVKGLFTLRRWRLQILYRGPRLAEIVTLLSAPWSALTLERRLARRLQAHRERVEALQARHGVDADYYLRENPDVAANGAPALLHYHEFGAAEGRAPNRAAAEARAARNAPATPVQA